MRCFLSLSFENSLETRARLRKLAAECISSTTNIVGIFLKEKLGHRKLQQNIDCATAHVN